MRLFHLADLHLGKRVNEFSMLEDQRHILQQILLMARDRKPDAMLIAGDVYDKAVPPAEAVGLLDSFLTELSGLRVQVFLISGNHDSPERLDFGSRIMEKDGIHISSVFKGRPEKATLCDSFGPVRIYSLPFIRPSVAAPFLPQKPESFQQAVAMALQAVTLEESERNILLAHQFVVSGSRMPECCDSETLSLGGLDQVDASVFDGFDYVALGHLHGPQQVGRETIRYAGSPLKYSFSEVRHKKSVASVELGPKGEISIELIPLEPLRELREIKGPIESLLSPQVYSLGNTSDYIRAILTDQEEIYDPIGRLRAVYPNVMKLEFEKRSAGKGTASKTAASGDAARKSPLELFGEFYESRNDTPMNDAQEAVMRKILRELEEKP